MATEARPAFLAITGLPEHDTLDAAARFAVSLRDASGEGEFHPGVAECSRLAGRAFGGDGSAWAPLVKAVRQLLADRPLHTGPGQKSRRELRAFVAENADLLD
ncbi:MAG: hypothetical protein ABSB70_06555 [Candidatus Velthaea sp.]|jgi:hypothetical protein